MQQLHINSIINQVLRYVRVLLKLIFYYLQYLIHILCRYMNLFDLMCNYIII